MPALTNDTMAAAKDMTETDRDAMIRGMVEGLATRLKQDGNDVEGLAAAGQGLEGYGRTRQGSQLPLRPARRSPAMPIACASSTRA